MPERLPPALHPHAGTRSGELAGTQQRGSRTGRGAFFPHMAVCGYNLTIFSRWGCTVAYSKAKSRLARRPLEEIVLTPEHKMLVRKSFAALACDADLAAA